MEVILGKLKTLAKSFYVCTHLSQQCKISPMAATNHSFLSAVVISLNESKNIQRCLASLSFCDDTVVVDSGSTDNTVALAISAGARVIHQDWLGFGKQKQFAVEQAKYDWVLCIDADEVVGSVLQEQIQAVDFDTAQASAYRFPRRNHFLGKALHYGEGYPDVSLRLFDRRQAGWSDDTVHEGVRAEGRVDSLRGDLLHFSEDSIAGYLAKQAHYTDLQAQALFASGKPVGSFTCFTRPLVRFIKFYIFRRGFLDGMPGFIHISIGCFNTFCKYAKLIELQRNRE